MDCLRNLASTTAGELQIQIPTNLEENENEFFKSGSSLRSFGLGR